MIQNRRFVTGKEMFRDVGNRKTVSSLLYKYSRRNSIVRIRRNVYLPTNPVDGFVDENKYEIGLQFRSRLLSLLPFGHGILRIAEPGLEQDIPVLGQTFPPF